MKSKQMDYALNPATIQELKNCINNIIKEVEKVKDIQHAFLSNYIDLSVKDGIIFIKPEDIVRLEANGSYTIFYLTNNIKHLVSKNLKECESLLNPHYFFRCHTSNIINLQRVVKMVSNGNLYAKMSDDSMAEIAKKNKDVFLQKLKSI